MTQKRLLDEKSPEILAKRLKVESPKPAKIYNNICEYCQKTFRDSRDLTIHKESVHLKIKFGSKLKII